MIKKIKNIKLTIFTPEKEFSNGVDYEIKIEDDGTIIDAIGAIEKDIQENPEKSLFPLYKGFIRSYLQLIWDPRENIIYGDCAVNAYGPNREFIPLQEDINFNLYPNSNITLIVHAD